MVIVWAGADYLVKSAMGGIVMIRNKRRYSNDKN